MSTRVLGVGAMVARLRVVRRRKRNEPFGTVWPHRAARRMVTVNRVFTAVPEQVGRARHFAREVVGEEHARSYEVELVVSELAGNAVRHGGQGAGREFEVSMAVGGGAIIVAVRDGGLTGTPRAGTCDTESDSGRGLALVETVARRWGFHRDPAGTVVWAELDSVPSPPS
ncbi:ATP-binding protein [Thermopolyspora sp. NPDC052614]|uniref:ATP-binding protein n=1 Tax=Thermopolyspora sp. NPDC052614 TaxID=3155682 RepID=UPI00343EE3EC